MQEHTTSASAVVVVHRQARERHQEEVIRVRKRMERCRHDSRVVRHLKRLFRESGVLRTGSSYYWSLQNNGS